jgi:hypothetical protein
MTTDRTQALPPQQAPPDLYRVLVVANGTVGGRELLEEIEHRTRGRKAEVLVVAPALVGSRLKQALGDVDEGVAEARVRLERSLAELRRAGLDVRGEIGDSDPLLALEDGLRKFHADEVIIATHPPERSKWLEKDVVERAQQEIDVPITHVVVDLEGEDAQPHFERIEHISPRPRRDEGDTEDVDYLPPMPFRDRLTLVVGITGTIALGILAILCPENGEVSGGCAVRMLIAMAAFFVTLFHTVALIVMGSVRYHGFWEKAAADLVLFGIPPAILISLLLG